jgi:hypothetical protein
LESIDYCKALGVRLTVVIMDGLKEGDPTEKEGWIKKAKDWIIKNQKCPGSLGVLLSAKRLAWSFRPLN